MKAIFFHHVQMLQKFMTNAVYMLFIDCLYAEVNQHTQCFAYVKWFSMSNFHPYVNFQALDTHLPPQKKYHQVEGCI